MTPTYVEKHQTKGELRIGWASWDKDFHNRSIKWAYPDASNKISRGCPEVPFDILVDMTILAYMQGELSKVEIKRLRSALASNRLNRND